MNNIRLFYDKSLSINFSSKLDKSQSHYIYKVMRVGIGQTFSLFNKNGEAFNFYGYTGQETTQEVGNG